MAKSLERMTNNDLRNVAYGLYIPLDTNETKADLIAKIESARARQADLKAAVELVLDAKDPATLGPDGYPLPEAVAAQLGEEVSHEAVRMAADAVFEDREDNVARKAPQKAPKTAPDAPSGAEPPGDLPEARPDVIEATKAILDAGEPFERGAPALWAVRDKVPNATVSKADAAAAYESVTGNPWPWPPSASELKDLHAIHYPAALYHPEKRSITVKDEAAEAKAEKDGYARPEKMDPADWVKAWGRDTGASEEQQEAALKGIQEGIIRV